MHGVTRLGLLVALAGCGGAATGSGPTTPAAPTSPSPGARAEDGIDDAALVLAAHDLGGRVGDDRSRAELRLAADQTRAFLVAVTHALPPIELVPASASSSPAPSSSVRAPRFDPSSTLIQQLDATEACGHGADAHACAARLGTQLLTRLNGLQPPAELRPVKEGLLSALAALEESRVVVPTEVRWRVLREGTDAAARLAQALTLLLIERHVAQAVALSCPCQETAQLAARLADELAIGACSDAFERLLGTDGNNAVDPRPGLTALAAAECAPACARASLSTGNDDAVVAAAMACRAETSDTQFAPFQGASDALTTWVRAATSALVGLTGDAAVSAILAMRPTLPESLALPLPPPLFRAGSGRVVHVPAVTSAGGTLEVGGASALVWVGPTGDLVTTSPPVFALGGPQVPRQQIGSVAQLHDALTSITPGPFATAPVGLVFDGADRASRVASVVDVASHDHVDHRVGVVVRSGPYARYVPLRVVSTFDGRIYRVGEHTVTVLEHDRVAQRIALTAAPANAPDRLSGAIPEGPPSEPFALQLERDASAAVFARATDALATHGARASTPMVPQFVSALADLPVVQGTVAEPRVVALRAAVERHRAEAIRCLANVPSAGDGLPPSVDLHVVFDAHGRAVTLTATGDSPRSDAAATCVSRAARRWGLPSTVVAAEMHAPFVAETH